MTKLAAHSIISLLGEIGIYNVIHYENASYIPAESSAQISLKL